MPNASFTRDEVILTLDVLYRAEGKKLSARSNEIIGLSKELKELPIFPQNKRPENFRNCVGVSHQIESFLLGKSGAKSNWNVGGMFFRVDNEYRDKHELLHKIADAIRRNTPFLIDYQFGNSIEDADFPEGVILGHLHRMIEKRDGKKVSFSQRCDVCQLDMASIYRVSDGIMEHHLLVPPEELDIQKNYSPGMFITVCPNCHAVIHKYRPWLQRENYREVFR